MNVDINKLIKTKEFYISAVAALLSLVAAVLYLCGISDQISALVAVATFLGMALYAVSALLDKTWAALVAYLLVLFAVGAYIALEVDYISVCIAGIDARFTSAYLFQIGYMVFLGIAGAIPVIFAGRKNA